MDIKEAFGKLENDPEFKEWQNSNKKSYLVHFFKIADEQNKDIMQIGYYNPDDTITTFVVEKEDIKIIPEQEVFKKTKQKIKKLDINEIKIGFDKSLEIAEDFQKNNSKENEPAKIMVVIQNISGKAVYNVSYITKTCNALNMKIDASSGKLMSHELINLVNSVGKAG